ncbi:MAG TPA: NAD(P)H-quinone oxidoreductase [Allosphingosinicella sp.]
MNTATTPIRTTMMAIDPDEAGGPEVLKPVERPVPKPGPGEVLIEVAAAGVNRPDVMQRLGRYPPPPGAPTIPGLEVAGRVVAVGAGELPQWIGKPVCALVSGGGYAEYCTAPSGQCLSVPGTFTMVEAAALPETFFTVWANLFHHSYLGREDTLLVHGGTSGIGIAALLLGQIFELNVIVTAGSDEKCRRALEQGAAWAINYRTHDFVEEVRRLMEGRGVDVVLDMIGGDYVARNLACVADEGRHVSIAAQRGATAEIPLWEVMRRRLTLTGSTLRARSAEYKATLASEIRREVWPHLEVGRIRPVIDSVYPLARAAEAHARMESSEHVGKIVLQVK